VEATSPSTNPFPYLEVLYAYVMEGRLLSPYVTRAIPGLNVMRWLRWLDAKLKLGLTRLPDAIVYLDITPKCPASPGGAGQNSIDPAKDTGPRDVRDVV
jgi:hypothetical protein